MLGWILGVFCRYYLILYLIGMFVFGDGGGEGIFLKKWVLCLNWIFMLVLCESWFFIKNLVAVGCVCVRELDCILCVRK